MYKTMMAFTAGLLNVGTNAFAQNHAQLPAQAPIQTGNPLAELRPIHLPPEPSNWPAPGWYLLAFLIVALLVFIVWYWRRHKQSQSYLKHQQTKSALRELALFPQENKADYIRQCNALLKRVAIANYPAENPAQLSEEQWLQFLSQHCKSLDHQVFTLLKQGPYLPDDKLQASNIEPLTLGCQHWLSHHHEVAHA
ncbi:DUF4381 domain-containing protein [Pseudoteredinibacter isoporae]|uniref:DUF4381 domain-containing protein n=1 Tax=Pseudoteredinibacter isoporae TaxID=570281 RepID=UPI00310B41DF